MKAAQPAGRPNQRRRTRKDLLEAAARLMKEGRKPGLEEVAAAALVSRATAYRYFPSIDALLLEAALDVAVPEPATLFAGRTPADAVARLDRVELALHDMIDANEAPLRMMLANSLERIARGEDDGGLPARQNRRTPLIDAALAPGLRQLQPASRDMLRSALAIVIGTEAMVVCKDVLQLDATQARKVRRWAIRALVAAARRADPLD